MFKKFGNVFSMLKNAQQMQSRMSEMQEQLAHVRVEGNAGGGMVTVEATGQQKITAVRLEDSLLENPDKELIEDLLVGAINQALDKSRERAAEEMSKLAGEMNVPGLDEALSKLNPGNPDDDDSEDEPPPPIASL